jgi:AcrR family transcriptional regulator
MLANVSKVNRTRDSGATRAAILEAARARFVQDGFRQATIRAIAADARIDPAMVMRYYGNKRALFAAAIEVDLRLPEPDSIPRSRAGAIIAGFFLDRWEQDETLVALLRSAATNQPEAIDRMRDIFANQVTVLARELCDDPDEAATRAALVASQLLGVALTRYVVRLPPITALDRDELVGWLGPTLQRYVRGKLPRAGSRRSGVEWGS